MNMPSTDRAAAHTDDLVELTLPFGHRHASTARMVAAAVGADVGFDVDEIDELRLLVDEAVSVVVDVGGDTDARVSLRFATGAARAVTVSVAATTGPGLTRDDIDSLALRILEAVADEFAVTDGALVITKRRAARDDD